MVANDRLAQRMVTKHGAGERIPMAAVVVVLAHRNLAQDDVALPRYLVGGQGAVERHVGEQIDRDLQVRRGQIDVVNGAVVGGVSVDAAAVGLHRRGDLAAHAAGCSLEEQMLEVMREAGAEHRALVLAAGLDPNLHGNNRRGVVGLHEQSETVG